MFYYNAKYGFSVEAPSSRTIAGGIIAASALLLGELRHRDFRRFPYLQQRLLDPQLYMAGIDRNTDGERVVRLSSYPWFNPEGVPQYDSETYSSPRQWKQQHQQQILEQWTGDVPTEDSAIERAVRSAVDLQLRIGCSAIVLPSPLTTVADQTYVQETRWLDCGEAVCEQMRVSLPVYFSVALSESVLHAVNPLQHPLVQTISTQIATRSKISGIYLVVEQADAGSYVWAARDPLLNVLILIDDLVRGAGKQVVLNYFGSFGAVATAVGASIWSSGYYLSQRRLNLAGTTGRARPRYYCNRLAGDVGIEHDLKTLFDAGLGERVLGCTAADQPLRTALQSGLQPSAAPEWQYTNGNIGAASRHYIELLANLGLNLTSLDRSARVRAVHQWLRGAVNLATDIRSRGITDNQTDIVHQSVWLDVFERWRTYSGV